MCTKHWFACPRTEKISMLWIPSWAATSSSVWRRKARRRSREDGGIATTIGGHGLLPHHRRVWWSDCQCDWSVPITSVACWWKALLSSGCRGKCGSLQLASSEWFPRSKPLNIWLHYVLHCFSYACCDHCNFRSFSLFWSLLIKDFQVQYSNRIICKRLIN